jgi:hypothetical protein
MSARATVALLAAAACVVAAAPAFAAPSAKALSAQAATNAQHATAPHGLFGTITLLNGAKFTLRTVAGTVVHVDATQAIKSGDYSAPLYRGKRVLVTGTTGAGGVFQAVSVDRVNSLRGASSY